MHLGSRIIFILLLSLSFLLENLSLAKTSGLSNSFDEDTSNVIFDKILITGNDKTKAKIILREVSFKEGDTIPKEQLQDAIYRSKNRIFNTGLFVTVDLFIIDRGPVHKELLIVVKERWYIYPIPIFELADRNFNEWWQQRGHKLNRTNIGIFYTQKNVRGRNETLKTKVQFGFTKKFEIFYFIPYLTKSQKTGVTLDVSYILNKQVAYQYDDVHHKLAYLDYNKLGRERFRGGLTFSYRKKFYETHFLGSTFNYNHIADTVAILNPDYLLKGRTTQRYIAVEYDYVRDIRDVAYYPTKGSYFRFEAEKMGVGIFGDINQLNLIGEYSLFKPISKKLYFAGGLKQKISFPHPQPFLQTQALGYQKDYVSGYELYVINGQHFSLAKVNLKWKLFASNTKVSALPINQFRHIPFAIYLKAYSDAGYVVDNSNNHNTTKLSNTFLLGGGLGIDIVTYYDLVMRVEYSYNKLGQHGVFLHLGAGI